jgi:hypothetical protein
VDARTAVLFQRSFAIRKSAIADTYLAISASTICGAQAGRRPRRPERSFSFDRAREFRPFVMAVTTVPAAGNYISERQAAAAAQAQTTRATSYRARRKMPDRTMTPSSMLRWAL